MSAGDSGSDLGFVPSLRDAISRRERSTGGVASLNHRLITEIPAGMGGDSRLNHLTKLTSSVEQSVLVMCSTDFQNRILPHQILSLLSRFDIYFPMRRYDRIAG